jgi:hypothetical protein
MTGTFPATGQEIEATVVPGASPLIGIRSASAPVTGFSFASTVTGTTTTATVTPPDGTHTPEAVIQGVTETLQATVSSAVSLTGGTVSFSREGGSGLCSAPVPSGSTGAVVKCSVPLLNVGLDDVLAVYTPPGGSFGASASDVPIQVESPFNSTSNGGANSALKAGVVVNLSSTPFLTTSANPVSGVTIASGQALVAAPPAGITTASCTPTPAAPVASCDSLTGATVINGSAKGNNTFVAGPSSESFGDTGTGQNDTINFAGVATSVTTPLTVNFSGGPVNVAGSGPLANFTALAGSATYSFATGGANFTTFTSSTTGNTNYLAGGNGGYNLTATGTNNELDFSAAPGGVRVDLTGSSNPCGMATTGNPAPNCVSGQTGGNDIITGLTTLIGSSHGGNTFLAGSATSDFTGNGNGNTFVGGAGLDTFRSTGNGNTFQPGSGNAFFIDPAGSGNTVDFSKLTSPVTVNVSGGPVSLTGNDTATVGTSTQVAATYDFTSFGPTPATFLGSPKGSTFYAGSATNDFVGAQGATNILSFADASGASVRVCAVCSPGQAVLGSIDEAFSNITEFDGLAIGNTSFTAGDPDGTTFRATGSGNAIDFSQALGGVNAAVTLNPTTNQPVGTVTNSTATKSDPIFGMTTVTGSSNAANIMQSGTGPATYTFTANSNGNQFTGGSGTDNFSSTGSGNTFTVGTGPKTTLKDNGTGNTINFGSVPTSGTTPLQINASGTPVNGIANDSAVAGSLSYDFSSGGPGFTTLKGATTGNTDFFGPGAAAGYQFLGAGLKNTLDLSANVCGLTANMVTGQVKLTWGTPCASTGTDVMSDIANVVGAQNGPNVFDADLLGTSFTAASTSNTLSYAAFGGSGVCVNLVLNQVTQGCISGGSSDKFTFAPGALTVEGSPGSDTFEIGPTPVTLEGGGGTDTLDLTSYGSPATIDLNAGTITGSSLGAASFTPGTGCTSTVQPTSLCIGAINGTPLGDTFIANQTLNTASPITLNGGGGSDTLNLKDIGGPATVDMPITSGSGIANNNTCHGALLLGVKGVVCSGPGASPGILFTGISNLSGTSAGGDHVFAGSTVAGLNEPGSPGILDYAVAPPPTNATNTGLTFSVNGSSAGVVTNPSQQTVATFSGFGTFIGTQDNDTFVQLASGSYTFEGGAGNNSLDLSHAPSGTGLALTQALPVDGCSTGSSNDGSVSGAGTGVSDSFSCIGSVAGSASTLSLAGDTRASGVTVAMPLGTGPGSVTGDYALSFTGMSTIGGTPNTDTFQVGTAPMTIEGGGGHDALDLRSYGSAATVDLNQGKISGSSLGSTSFTPGCTSPTALCVTSVIGSPFADRFIANQQALTGTPVSISGNANDSLDLSDLKAPATIDMPINGGTGVANPGTCSGLVASAGTVCASAGIAPGITFTNISTLVGTLTGGDTVFAGTSTENLTDNLNNPGTLDYSVLPAPTNTGNGVAGITLNITTLYAGTVMSPASIGGSATFSGFGTFNGTPDNDNFVQAAAGTYTFNGGAGLNTLDLSGAPSTNINLTTPGSGCTTGINNNNGTATGAGVSDTFTCMNAVTSSTLEFQVHPGQTATVQGNGQGTLVLLGDVLGAGVTVTLPNGPTLGTVTGDGYNFSFSGMNTIDGTPYSDVFVPGNNTATPTGSCSVPTCINSEGGNDWLDYAGAPAAATVNLSTTSYTVPSGYPNAGTVVPPHTATGGSGGTITVNGIANVEGTSLWNDILVGGPGPGRLTGGGGNERFVPTGGDDFIQGGSGTNTVDLSRLPGSTKLNLGLSGPQALGSAADGTVTLVPDTIQTAIASPAGSTLIGGTGDNVTLMGGTGPDTLIAGTGSQTLIGGGGNDVLVAGIGNDTLIGGSQAVTFIPGTQGLDTLQSSRVGNTLSYGNVPAGATWKRPPLNFSGGVQVNLSGQQVTIPVGTHTGTPLSQLTATGGWGATVDLSGAGVTRFVGSTAADVIVSGNGDSITGNGPNDLFIVAGQNSTLTAAANSSPTFLFEPTGSNTIHGGGNATVDFTQAPGIPNGKTTTGVTVNLQAGIASGGGFPGVQALSGVLNINGSLFDDVLIANAPNAVVNGEGGNDHLQTGPTGGDTLIGGGFGTDTFCAANSCAAGGTTAGGVNTDTLKGGSGVNVFFARNQTVDNIIGVGSANEAQVDPGDHLTDIQTLIP